MLINKLKIIYATETGQAKAIAERLSETITNIGIEHDLIGISDVKDNSIENEQLIIFIASTTGDGEPPEMARKFWRKIKKEKPKLAGLKFSILGLGDSNYSTFCNFPKMLDKMLLGLGGQYFSSSQYADDAVGLELVTEDWLEKVVDHLKQMFPESYNNKLNELNINDENKSPKHNKTPENTAISADINTGKALVETNGMKPNAAISTDISAGKTVVETDGKKPNSIAYNSANVPAMLKADDVFLEGIDLSLPLPCSSVLKLSYVKEDGYLLKDLSPLFPSYPFKGSEIIEAKITKAIALTDSPKVKKVGLLELESPAFKNSYNPGDSIGVFPRNSPEIADNIFERLGVSDLADHRCTVTLVADKVADPRKVENKIPNVNGLSLRAFFEWVFDLNAPLKKSVLLKFSQYTSCLEEKRILEVLSSREGSVLYKKLFFDLKFSLVDFLDLFHTCKPPMELLFEHLSRLKPRYFTICSSPLVDDSKIEIVFSVIDNLRDAVPSMRKLKGVTTSWFEGLINKNTLHQDVKMNIYIRKSTQFNPSSELGQPMIMVGPGTGVAPFVGFLRHREKVLNLMKGGVESLGESWLFFGCRYELEDYIFRDELAGYVSRGVLSKLITSFSRDLPSANLPIIDSTINTSLINDLPSTDSTTNDSNLNNLPITHTNIASNVTRPKYVQDNLMLHGSEIYKLISESKCVIYVCGDAKGMSVDVLKAFQNILVDHSDMDIKAATEYLQNMRTTGRYREDVWT